MATDPTTIYDVLLDFVKIGTGVLIGGFFSQWTLSKTHKHERETKQIEQKKEFLNELSRLFDKYNNYLLLDNTNSLGTDLGVMLESPFSDLLHNQSNIIPTLTTIQRLSFTINNSIMIEHIDTIVAIEKKKRSNLFKVFSTDKNKKAIIDSEKASQWQKYNDELNPITLSFLQEISDSYINIYK